MKLQVLTIYLILSGMAAADDRKGIPEVIAREGEFALEAIEEHGDEKTRQHLAEVRLRARVTEWNAQRNEKYNVDLGAAAIREMRAMYPHISGNHLVTFGKWAMGYYDESEKHVSEQKIREWRQLVTGSVEWIAAGKAKQMPPAEGMFKFLEAAATKMGRQQQFQQGSRWTREYGFDPSKRRLSTQEWAHLIRAGEIDPTLGIALDKFLHDEKVNGGHLYMDFTQFKKRNAEAFEKIQEQDFRNASFASEVRASSPRPFPAPAPTITVSADEIQLAERAFDVQVDLLERAAKEGPDTIKAATTRQIAALKEYRQVVEGKGNRDAVSAAQKKLTLAQTNLQVTQAEENFKNSEIQDKLANVNLAVDAVDALTKLVGLKDPEAAKILSASSKLGGAIVSNIISLNPMGLASAIVNFFSSLFGGVSDTELILQAIREVRQDIADMRKEMHRLFQFTNEHMDERFDALNEIVITEFARMDQRLTQEFSGIRTMNQQTHAALNLILEEMVAGERRDAVAKGATAKTTAENKFQHAFNGELVSRGSLNEEEFDSLLFTILNCANKTSISTAFSIDVGGVAVPELSTEQLGALYLKLGRGALKTDSRIPSAALLPFVAQVYAAMGHPLAKGPDGIPHFEIPNPILWAYCVELYTKTHKSSNVEVQKWLANYERWVDKTPGAVAMKMLQAGRNARSVSHELLLNPAPLAKAHDEGRVLLSKLREKGREAYKSAAEHGLDVHAGPFQESFYRPSLKHSGQAIIPNCTQNSQELPPDFSPTSKEYQLELNESHVELIEAFANAIPPEYRIAEALGLGKLTVCISELGWERDPQHNEYTTNYGTMYDWQQHRHGYPKLSFSVRFDGREVKSIPYVFPEKFRYERRSYFHDASSLRRFVLNFVAHSPGAVHGSNLTGTFSPVFFKRILDHVNRDKIVIDDRKMMSELFGGSKEFDKEILAPQGCIHNTVFITEHFSPWYYLKDRKGVLLTHLLTKVNDQRFRGPVVSYLSEQRKSPAGYLRQDFLQPEFQEVSSEFLNLLRDEQASFYPTLTLIKADGGFVDGKELQEAVKQHYQDSRAGLEAFLKHSLEPLVPEKATPEAALSLKTELMALADKVYSERIYPGLVEASRIDIIEGYHRRIQNSMLGERKPLAPYLSKVTRAGLPPSLQEVVLDFESLLLNEYGAFFSAWRDEYREAMGKEQIVVQIQEAFFPPQLVTADVLGSNARARFALVDAKMQDFLKNRLEKFNDSGDAASAKRLSDELSSVPMAVFEGELKPVETTNHLPVLVERMLRRKAADHEAKIRDALRDQNGNSDMAFKETMVAMDGLTQLIDLSEEFATARPAARTPIGLYLDDIQLLTALHESDEAIIFGSGLWGSEDVIAISQQYGLPLYSPSEEDLIDWWEKNLAYNEIRLEKQLAELRENLPEHKLISNAIRDGEELIRKQTQN